MAPNMNLVQDVLIVPIINLSVALNAPAACGRWNGNTRTIHSLAVSWLLVTFEVVWSCENKQDGSLEKAENISSSSCGCLHDHHFTAAQAHSREKHVLSSSISDDAGADLVWTMAGLNRAWTPLQASKVTSQCFTWRVKQNLVYQLNNCAITFSIYLGKQVFKLPS